MSIDNIKNLYGQVKVKSKAINAVAEATGKSYGGVKNNWLCESGGWSVPDEHIEITTTVLQRLIAKQNTVKTE